MRIIPVHYYILVVGTIFHLVGIFMVYAVRTENRCMRHYYVETIRHPTRDCETQNVLMSKCDGYCSKSHTVPKVSFGPVLHKPFKYKCKCCRDLVSVLKAVRLRCKDGKNIYASYRFIIRCGCDHCHFR